MEIVEQVSSEDQHGDRGALNATAAGGSASRGRAAELIVARKRKAAGPRSRRRVVAVNPHVIESISDFIPVVAPTPPTATGRRSTSTPTSSRRIAKALRAEKLVLLTTSRA